MTFFWFWLLVMAAVTNLLDQLSVSLLKSRPTADRALAPGSKFRPFTRGGSFFTWKTPTLMNPMQLPNLCHSPWSNVFAKSSNECCKQNLGGRWICHSRKYISHTSFIEFCFQQENWNFSSLSKFWYENITYWNRWNFKVFGVSNLTSRIKK